MFGLVMVSIAQLVQAPKRCREVVRTLFGFLIKSRIKGSDFYEGGHLLRAALNLYFFFHKLIILG
jgi:hypothetical protein